MSGCEWIVEAHGCSASSLADPACLRTLFDDLVSGMHLRPVEQPLWHRFPGPGGITGVTLLAESHIACHTFPEFGSLCLNVFCCVPRPEWPFEPYLAAHFGATQVTVRRVERPYGAAVIGGANE
jgi:S-adenosylmethionine decarboxylase